MSLTVDLVRDMARRLAPPPPPPGSSPYRHMRIVYTDLALEKTKERLFQASRHRSARIHKKLVKRFGGEFRLRPAMFSVGGTLYAHPAHRAQIEAALVAAGVRVA